MSLFTYEDPFVHKGGSITALPDYFIDFLSDSDRADQQRISGLILKFAVDEKVIDTQEGRFVPNPIENMGSWIWLVNWMNFRSLVHRTQYAKLLNSLDAGDGTAINLILDLHARLGGLYDPRLLNTLANRTMSSLGMIPYRVDDPDDVITWEIIHKQSPYIWLLVLMQNLIRSEGHKLG